MMPKFTPLPKEQVGDKTTPKFRSATTPTKAFYLTDAIAEFVMLQKYGLSLQQFFWKKTVNEKLSIEFKKIKNMIIAMIKRNNKITALQLLGVVLAKFKQDKHMATEDVVDDTTEEESEVNLYEYVVKQINKTPVNVVNAFKDLEKKISGEKKD